MPSKEQLEIVLYKILYDKRANNEEKKNFLRQQFDDENAELMYILSNAALQQPTNLAELRNQITQYLLTHMGPDIYKTLREAINGLYQKGYVTEADRDLVRELSISGDKHLQAVWDTYTVMRSEDDLANSIQVMCSVKRGKMEPKPESDEKKFTINGPQAAQQPAPGGF